MSLMDDVKAICDRLAPQGWRDLLCAVTGKALDIQQPSAEALKTALLTPLPSLNRTLIGFEDFDPQGAQGITPYQPSASLLYHALASPRVVRDDRGALLRAFPTLAEIETVENLVFGIQPRSLAQVAQAVGATDAQKFAVTTFAVEYRAAPDTAHGQYADNTFSRTGIARVGTARPRYLSELRGFWPEDENNDHAFRVIPVRFAVWLAMQVQGSDAAVMPLTSVGSEGEIAEEAARAFWIPVHKLFDGPECLADLTLDFEARAKFLNLKLQKVRQAAMPEAPLQTEYPFVIEEGLAQLEERGTMGRFVVVPTVRKRLIEPASREGKPLTYQVPPGDTHGFATFATMDRGTGNRGEFRTFPAYVHARTKVVDGKQIDLNEIEDVNLEVSKGGYEALMYMDFTGEGWLDISVPALQGEPLVYPSTRAAYVILGAPDFFPSAGQRELNLWSLSNRLPAAFQNGQIWAVPPDPLSDVRLPANLQLDGHPFDPNETGMTAVVAIKGAPTTPSLSRYEADIVRASTLPDDAAGIFAPGWDIARDKDADDRPHLAVYGLGSPFPEDAKLCAALSAFWPAVAPDIYRTVRRGKETLGPAGTVVPLTDAEIGQVGSLPWDGVPGPVVLEEAGEEFLEMARFSHVDYVANVMENRLSLRLTARITAEEYQRRVLVAARTHFVLGNGVDINTTRSNWLFYSFQSVGTGSPELVEAQQQAGRVLKGNVYRVAACYADEDVPLIPSPKGHRFVRIRLQQKHLLYASAEDAFALKKRLGMDLRFAAVPAE